MNITFRTAPTFDVSGVAETIELYGVDACSTALHSLLHSVIEVLARVVGDDLATRILERPNGQ
ncbi:MAG TPA: hypothetical protein VM100_01280 [Longimicrobiales bacterium]|nr:hypothetical protein [Longimicrobiales bacterium]